MIETSREVHRLAVVLPPEVEKFASANGLPSSDRLSNPIVAFNAITQATNIFSRNADAARAVLTNPIQPTEEEKDRKTKALTEVQVVTDMASQYIRLIEQQLLETFPTKDSFVSFGSSSTTEEGNIGEMLGNLFDDMVSRHRTK